MTFTTKNWQNLPTQTTKINAAGLIDLETRLAAYTDLLTRGYYNLKNPSFGVAGDGSTNDSTAIQTVLDTAGAAGGGVVLAPPGTYIAHGLAINYDNIVLVGCGWGTVFKQPTGTADNTYLISVQGTGTTTSTNKFGFKIADIQLLGRSDSDTFTQYVHLLALSGVSDVEVRRVKFKSWRGDAVYLGSGLTSTVERHNEDVHIEDCLFDGNGKNNRNGTSVIDGTDVWIKNCKYTDCTASSMPGPIDLEPNANAYHRLRGIHIVDNTFDNCGGNVGEISFDCIEAQASLTTPTRDIHIVNNTIRNSQNSDAGIFLRHSQTPTATTVPNNIEVRDNTIIDHPHDPVYVEGIRGLEIADNYLGSTNAAGAQFINMGWAHGVMDVKILDNHIHLNAATNNETGVAIATVSRCQIRNNTFDNIGRLMNMVANGSSTSANIDFFDNRIVGTVAFAVCGKAGGHTTTATTNGMGGNQLNDLDHDTTIFRSSACRQGHRSTGKSITSAATVQLTGDTDHFNITGTNNMTTGIAGGWPGRKVVLRFSGILTVTNGGGSGATVLNLAGANYTTANRKVLCLSFESDADGWTEESRT